MNRKDWGLVAAIAGVGLAMMLKRRHEVAEDRPPPERPRPTRGNRKARTVTAAQMARKAGIPPTQFRAALRAGNLGWHEERAPWNAAMGSPEYQDMKRVLDALRAKSGSRRR